MLLLGEHLEIPGMILMYFSKTWKIMKENLRFFIPLLIIVGLISFLLEIISDLLRKEWLLLSFAFDLIVLVLGLIISLGLIKISLNFCDNLKSKIADLFSQYRLFFRYLFASILYGLVVLLGMIFLIIPGIYLAVRFWFYDYFIVDKRAGIIESLKRSWRITQGSAWNLFLFSLLLIGINLLGILCLLVGLFATVPTTMIASAFVYRKLLAQAEVSQ